MQLVEEKYDPFNPDFTVIISIVTAAELYALATKNNWGDKRITALTNFLDALVIVDISDWRLVDLYAQIDAFSQNKLPHTNQFSARNMGKNDLWIAATAALTKATLLTSDHDFDHLAGEMIELETILFP